MTDSSGEARKGQDLGSAPPAERVTPLYQRVYSILVAEAGATNSVSDRMQFENFWLRSDDPNEYRFIGTLGFGGKFWKGRSEWHVSCYPEDSTPERRATIDRTNAALDVLHGAEQPPAAERTQ